MFFFHHGTHCYSNHLAPENISSLGEMLQAAAQAKQFTIA
jgi:hypothetical protein